MKRLTHIRVNGMKSGFWSPNKKGELVDRLAQYEDIGLEPEEIKKKLTVAEVTVHIDASELKEKVIVELKRANNRRM